MRTTDRGRSLVRGRVLSATGRATSAIVGATGRSLDPGNPLYYAQQYGLKLWLRADMGITLGGTPRAEGTAPPAVTISGTATTLVGLYMQCDTAGITGVATFKWSIDNGSTFVATLVPIAASVVLGATGITAAFPGGAEAYLTDNIWQGTVSTWADQSGNANHAVQATASRQVLFSVAGFGGHSAVNYGAGGTFGYATPSMSLADSTFVAAFVGDASSGYLATHVTDSGAAGDYFTCATNPSSFHDRGGGDSMRVAPSPAPWRDSVNRTAGSSCSSTHASHAVYMNGVDQNAATYLSFSNNPGSTPTAGLLYVGCNQAYSAPLRGLYRELAVFSSKLPDSVHLSLHYGMVARAPGAF